MLAEIKMMGLILSYAKALVNRTRSFMRSSYFLNNEAQHAIIISYHLHYCFCMLLQVFNSKELLLAHDLCKRNQQVDPSVSWIMDYQEENCVYLEWRHAGAEYMQSIFSREPMLPPGGEAINKIKKGRKRMKNYASPTFSHPEWRGGKLGLSILPVKALAGCLEMQIMSGAIQDIPKLPHNNS